MYDPWNLGGLNPSFFVIWGGLAPPSPYVEPPLARAVLSHFGSSWSSKACSAFRGEIVELLQHRGSFQWLAYAYPLVPSAWNNLFPFLACLPSAWNYLLS